MSIVQVVAILGSIPLFSLRAFLPAFLTALLLTYPEYFPGLDAVPSLPEDAFLSKDWVLISLGILSVLEIVGDKSSEIRNLLKNAEPYFKPLFFLLVNLGFMDEASVEILQEVQLAAFDPLWILLGLGTIAVHWLSSLRRDFINFLEDIDEDDNLFIGKITSWLEDSLVLFGFFLLIFTGLVMVVIYFMAIAFLVYLSKKYERKLEQQKTICPNCGESNFPFAVKCYNCKEPQPAVHAIGILGQRKKKMISDVKKHQLNLISHRKCPDCGNKQTSPSIHQNCGQCGRSLFVSPSEIEFIKNQDQKFYKITALSFVLGFIPVLGFLISALMANIHLFSPYRRYIPKGSSFLTKVLIKFLTFLLFILGIALGFIAAPAYIIMRYVIWKRQFKRRIAKS
jgi:ribosomal protein S27AE